MTDAEKIRVLRKDLGLTLEKFATPLGVGPSAISNIEGGTRGLTNQMIQAVCSVYHVSEEWLRTGEGEMYVEVSPMEEILERLATIKMTIKNNDDKHAVQIAKFKERLATAILNLNDEGCDLVIKFIEDMGYVKKEEND